jgi:hypothetical protein
LRDFPCEPRRLVNGLISAVGEVTVVVTEVAYVGVLVWEWV